MVPTAGLMDHVTPVLDVPPTAAENCWVWDPVRVAVAGVSDRVIEGFSVTVALADLVGSTTDLAITVTL